MAQIAVRILSQLLAQDENTVERRAQLVGHVGEEFRFVLRRQREFRRFLFDRTARLFDFLVLGFDFDVAVGQLLRLLLQLFVRLLQFTLLSLQLGGELLRLLQQPFGLHGGFDGVEHDADGHRQLLEK